VNYDVVIIGAGAAGLICAISAGERGRKVLLIDKASSVGSKIRISGGGRCNFTNLHATPTNYISQNSRFCVSALKRYSQHDFIKLVENYNIKYHEKTLGQLFCDGSAEQIVDMLMAECKQAGVEFALKTSIKSVEKIGEEFHISLNKGKKITAESLVIATGGQSIPKMGATAWGLDIAKQFGLKVVPPRAGLVPLTLGGTTLERMQSLAGISIEAVVSCNGASFREGLLFTHRGLSGPTILQISSYWKEGDIVIINLAPDMDIFSELKALRNSKPRQEIQTALNELLPKRLVQYICNANNYSGRIADLSNVALKNIADNINAWHILPQGTEGYRTAEVTLGGVDTAELSSKTFETREVSGLYFIGEVVDVTGHLGGYNFQWAWSSGYACGQFT